MLLDPGDSVESMKSLVFFDISKLEAELVEIMKQEEVCFIYTSKRRCFLLINM